MKHEEMLKEFPVTLCTITAFGSHVKKDVCINVRAKRAKLVGSTYHHPDGRRTYAKKLMKLNCDDPSGFILTRDIVCLEKDVDAAIKLIRSSFVEQVDFLVERFKAMQVAVAAEPEINYHERKNGEWEF